MDVNRFLSDYPNGAFIATLALSDSEFTSVYFCYDDALVACNELLELLPFAFFELSDSRCFIREIRTNGDVIDHFVR